MHLLSLSLSLLPPEIAVASVQVIIAVQILLSAAVLKLAKKSSYLIRLDPWRVSQPGGCPRSYCFGIFG